MSDLTGLSLLSAIASVRQAHITRAATDIAISGPSPGDRPHPLADPAPRLAPRRVTEPEPRVEPRIIQRPVLVEHVVIPLPETAAPRTDSGPIEPPWHQLAWELPIASPPAAQVKVIYVLPDTPRKGTLYDAMM